MHEFRSVTGASVTADALAEQLSADRPPDPAAPVLPAGAQRITLTAKGFDADITLGLWLTTTDGRQEQVRFARLGSGADRRAARWRGPHRARSGDRGVGDPGLPA